MVDLALHFVSWHKIGLSDDFSSSEGSHLESRVVSSEELSKVLGFFACVLQEGPQGFRRCLWDQIWHFSILAAHAIWLTCFSVLVVKELGLASLMFADLAHCAY